MDEATQRAADQAVLDAVLSFAATHPAPELDPFRDALAGWGTEWQPVPPAGLAAASLLDDATRAAPPATRALLDTHLAHRGTRCWEQSYKAADNVVGADMLAAYGFAEIVGRRGPFLSETVRAGIGLWGPGIAYPRHFHRAEEVYVVLSGSAAFALEGDPLLPRGPGEAVHVTPSRPHGFTTGPAPFAVFYIWKGGDLREISSFR